MQSSISLEVMVSAWQSATQQQRNDAVSLLKNQPSQQAVDTPSIIRWEALARRLSVSKRTVRNAIENAGITPVKLPGRNRSVGIRACDVWMLEGGAA